MSMDVMPVKRVLCVGNAVVDCISLVDKFPAEDSEGMGIDFYWQRGGNATNSCTVLSLLNVPCEFLGVLPTVGPEAKWLHEDLSKAGIKFDNCVTTFGQCPVSSSIINITTGSRTILGFTRNCPELKYLEFKEKLKADFSPYPWIHFELRMETKEVVSMMKEVNDYNLQQQKTQTGVRPIVVSIEVEHPETPNPELTMLDADYIFLSKDFSQSRGCSNMQETLHRLYHLCKPGSVLVCAWGDQGASARRDDKVITVPAIAGVKVVDSLGAGDTFNAGFITATLRQYKAIHSINSTTSSTFSGNSSSDDKNNISVDSCIDLQKSLEFACHVAGYKCGIFGYNGLKDFQKH